MLVVTDFIDWAQLNMCVVTDLIDWAHLHMVVVTAGCGSSISVLSVCSKSVLLFFSHVLNCSIYVGSGEVLVPWWVAYLPAGGSSPVHQGLFPHLDCWLRITDMDFQPTR